MLHSNLLAININIFYLKEGQVEQALLRSTLKRTEEQLFEYPSVVRCHRAFLVNADKIRHVNGNSQGLQLILKNIKTEIPVSRNFSKALKERMDSLKLS